MPVVFFDEKTVVFVWLCHSVGVDLLNGFTDTHPEGQIGEDLHYAALVRKRRLLQHRKVFHQTVVDDILHDLVDEVNLSAVESCIRLPVPLLYICPEKPKM